MAIQLFNLECSLDKQVSIRVNIFFFAPIQISKDYYSQPKIVLKFGRVYILFLMD